MADTGTGVALSLEGLDSLPKAVSRPSYSREQLTPGILHFGPGNFHRAHQAVYLDRLMNTGSDLDWAVLGASVMPGDQALRSTLAKQDFLSTVIAQSADDADVSVTGVMVDYLPVTDAGVDSQAVLAALADPAIRIVSMTVTEGGYFVDPESGLFDSSHPAIQRDAQNFNEPHSVFGLIARALMARRDNGQPAFTVMSCDNLPHNGAVTRRAVTGMASLVDPELAEWIENHSSFPSGMVDRIAPATGPRERALVVSEHGVADAAPVFCEDYLQWVLEDDFVNGRPALDAVGVQFVSDVTPFETMKIRILNGGHAVIAYPGALLDIEFADQAMGHPLISAFLDKVERDEILPVVPEVPDTSLDDYLAHIKRRFANPNIGDTTRRLCHDGSNRQPKFIVPTIADRLTGGNSVDGLALASALWCRYCYGTTDSGAVIEPNDPSWERLNTLAQAAKDDPAQWFSLRDVYGDTADDAAFRTAFTRSLRALWQDGTAAVLERYTSAS